MRYLLLAALLALSACGGGSSSIQPAPPSPQPRTAPLHYGYFCIDGNQIAETAGHVDYVMTCDQGDWNLAVYDAFRASQTITQLEEAKARGIKEAWVSIGWLVLAQQPGCGTVCFVPRPDGALRLAAFLKQARAAGVAAMATVLYVSDEPELRGLTDATLLPVLRMVKATWPGPKLAVIYGSTRTYPGLSEYDLVGRDEYGRGAGVLNDPVPIGPAQMLLLVPGGSDGLRNNGPPDDPQSFRDYAMAHANVYAIVAFVWFDRTDEHGRFQKGIRSNGMAAKYIAVGCTVTGKC